MTVMPPMEDPMTREDVDRERTLDRLPNLSRKDLLWLGRKVRKELNARYEADRALRERVDGARAGMANFLAGVTWALACRQSLRRSKEHAPDTGKRPASGEMWLPHELLYALRHEVKERRWSPLGAESWPSVKQWLIVENRRHLGDAERARRAAEGGMQVDTFRIKLAGQTAAIHIDLGSDDRVS